MLVSWQSLFLHYLLYTLEEATPSPDKGEELGNRASNPSLHKKKAPIATPNEMINHSSIIPVSGLNSVSGVRNLEMGYCFWRSVFSVKAITLFGTWNVHMLNQAGLFGQLLQEFERYLLDMLGISDIHWTGSDGKTSFFFCQQDSHKRDVGFVLNQPFDGFKPVSNTIIMAWIRTGHTQVTIVPVYVPTNSAHDADKDDSYVHLQGVLNEIPRRNVKIVMADFNGQLGGDCLSVERTVRA